MCVHVALCSRACHSPSPSSSLCAVVCVLLSSQSPAQAEALEVLKGVLWDFVTKK